VPDRAVGDRGAGAGSSAPREARTGAEPAAASEVTQGARTRRLTFRRLSGLDRSGPPPPQVAAGQPLRPWTIPNAIGFVRLALIPVFIVLALSSADGNSAAAAALFAVIGWGDYADGIAARVSGQYSRLGALMDPVTDRLLAIAGVVVCWHFALLPRWALAVLVVRELAMLALGRYGLSRGVELRVNWPGRLSVAPLMGGIFFALAGLEEFGAVLFYVGLALSLTATALYVRDGRRQVTRTQPQAKL
jgi:cardiolipin synthase (CMP-forming)